MQSSAASLGMFEAQGTVMHAVGWINTGVWRLGMDGSAVPTVALAILIRALFGGSRAVRSAAQAVRPRATQAARNMSSSEEHATGKQCVVIVVRGWPHDSHGGPRLIVCGGMLRGQSLPPGHTLCLQLQLCLIACGNVQSKKLVTSVGCF